MTSTPRTPFHELVAAAFVGMAVALPLATALVARDARPDPVRPAPDPVEMEVAVDQPVSAPAAAAPAPVVRVPVTAPLVARAVAAPAPLAAPVAPPVAPVRETAPVLVVVTADAALTRPEACPATSNGIARRSDGSFLLDRRVVDGYAKNPGSLARQARVAWHRGADGRTDGFRLGGIACGSELHAAGLRNGDVVHAINGKPLTTIPQALWAYSSLRGADELVLRVTRKGKVRSLRYHLG